MVHAAVAAGLYGKSGRIGTLMLKKSQDRSGLPIFPVVRTFCRVARSSYTQGMGHEENSALTLLFGKQGGTAAPGTNSDMKASRASMVSRTPSR